MMDYGMKSYIYVLSYLPELKKLSHKNHFIWLVVPNVK